MSLTDVTEHPFRCGVKSVNESLDLLDSYSTLIPDGEIQRYQNYLSAAKRFLPLCAEFIDMIYHNKNFYIFNAFREFIVKYPKSKQNLANPKQITTAFIEYYIRIRAQRIKKFVKEEDDGFKFLVSNTTNIYNTLVVYTNLVRASSVLLQLNVTK